MMTTSEHVLKVIENYRRWKRIEHTLIMVLIAFSGGVAGALTCLWVAHRHFSVFTSAF